MISTLCANRCGLDRERGTAYCAECNAAAAAAREWTGADATRHWDGTRWLHSNGTAWMGVQGEDLAPVEHIIAAEREAHALEQEALGRAQQRTGIALLLLVAVGAGLLVLAWWLLSMLLHWFLGGIVGWIVAGILCIAPIALARGVMTDLVTGPWNPYQHIQTRNGKIYTRRNARYWRP
jgi:hypothetical protein